jgi:valyl-tRNA synthetase
VALLIKDAEPIAKQRLARHREHFVRLARVEPVEAVETLPQGGVQVIVDGATLVLSLGEVIDLARERERLGKEIGKLDTELVKIGAKLRNPDFLAKARPEIIEEQRERQTDTARDRERLKAAFDQLVLANARD